jgi:ABC-2 type transport system permease protein
MKKILRIVVYEYRRQVARRAFIGTLLFPLFIIGISVAIGLITATTTIDSDKGVIGYVDPSGALAKAVPPPADSDHPIQKFADAAEARAALEDDRLIAYYELAPDFADTRKAYMYYWQVEPGRAVRRAFERFALSADLAGLDPQTAARLDQGNTYTYVSLDGARDFSEDNFMVFLMPLFTAILFMIALFSGASYLMQAVVDEKENRTIEILVTSVTPTQLMTGKVVGLAGVGLTQIGVWLVGISAALFILRDRLDFLQGISVEPSFIALALVLYVLQYLVLGAIMAGIGSTVVDAKQGQSYATPFTLLATLPVFFITVILFDPNGVIAVVLSLFPLTSPMTLLMRTGMTSVPAWQVIAAIALLAVSAVGAMWLAGRVFRAGMLRYGQRMSIAEIAASVRF